MAGRRQHYIPRSYLKAFAIPEDDKLIWLYRKGWKQPRRVGLRDVAVESDFYSKPSDECTRTLDDSITDYEGTEFLSSLTNLRECSIGDEIDGDACANVFSHLIIRGAHIRGVMSEATIGVFEIFQDALGSEDSLRNLLGVDTDNTTSKIIQELKNYIVEHSLEELSGLSAQTILRLSRFLLRKKFSEFASEINPALETVKAILNTDVPELVRDSHQNALKDNLVPEPRSKVFRDMEWEVVAAPKEGAILPDCVVLGITASGDWVPFIIGDDKGLDIAIVPLSPRMILIGRTKNIIKFEMADFNKHAIAASHQFFLSAFESKNLNSVSHHIAKQPRSFLTKLVEEVRAEHGLEKCLKNADANGSDHQVPVKFPVPEYNVQFIDCAAEDHAKDIAATVSTIVSEFSRTLPLACLAGLTFASDYPLALQNLDRGFKNSTNLEATNTECGTGVAMAPTVMRNGKYLRRIIMVSGVAEALMGEDEDARNVAIGIIWSQLAMVSLFEMMNVALPDLLMKPLPVSQDGSLYIYLDGLFESYFGARRCAPFHKKLMDDYNSGLIEIIDHMNKQVPSEKNGYQSHKDAGKLFEEVVLIFVEVLRQSAIYIGHSDGLKREPTLSQHLQNKLNDVNLLDWFFLFQRDLKDLYKRAGKWEHQNEFFVLNTHLERLFLQFGMVIEWHDKTGMYLHVFPI